MPINQLLTRMGFRYSCHELEDVVSSYEKYFGIRMSFEDADRMLTLFDELCDIFQQYDEEDRGPLEFFEPLLG